MAIINFIIVYLPLLYSIGFARVNQLWNRLFESVFKNALGSSETSRITVLKSRFGVQISKKQQTSGIK